MNEQDIETLQKELEQFKKEKEVIRNIVGQIGGVEFTKRDKMVNILFILLIVLLFCLDISRHLFHLEVPLPPLFSLEIGILLISIKIIWMMHKQAKVEHFQFWVLHSIEFRLNDLAKRMVKIDEKIG